MQFLFPSTMVGFTFVFTVTAVLAQRCAQIASRADADAAAAAELQSIRLAEAEAKQREMTNEVLDGA
jgi:hypothetical protein